MSHAVTNDMNCFYDGVPSLRCAVLPMTSLEKRFLTPLRYVRNDRRALGLGGSGRRGGAAAPQTTPFFLKQRRVIPNAVRNLLFGTLLPVIFYCLIGHNSNDRLPDFENIPLGMAVR